MLFHEYNREHSTLICDQLYEFYTLIKLDRPCVQYRRMILCTLHNFEIIPVVIIGVGVVAELVGPSW